MPTEDATNLLFAYRGSYGRLCGLACKALHDGYDPNAVSEAFEGDGSSIDPTLYKIRSAWVDQNAAFHRAVEAHGLPAVQVVSHDAAKAVAGEWFIDVNDIGRAVGAR